MKKMRVFLPIIVALVGVFFFTQCKKDHSCKMRLTCYYSSNGMDADSVVPFALISFDTVKYNSGLAVDTNIARVQDFPTNGLGVFEYTLNYPALLIVNAVKIDSVGGLAKKYTGTAQVQVNEGETTEKTILMVETN
ncbi:MAG: hypothetical protein IKH15_12635 [Bacteroidales bacterium]|jgi:hypothetical protein|nr:hypothetical protein [Bacteroidales bacterium]MBQ2513652.1 hypothetical protein [Bacteroidales bacterium]MBR3468047.1 hypothetical protein [Bacteroidales bacterium]MBR4638168.1 hypothetical protein [Bacteroidales bacterium]MBR6174838.1 hypothetical protein [Bacteroidales bacterium]